MVERFEPYTTAEGDMVDEIAFRRFGTSSGATERILDANPGLAAMGEVLPAGALIQIPVDGAVVTDRKKTARRLWD